MPHIFGGPDNLGHTTTPNVPINPNPLPMFNPTITPGGGPAPVKGAPQAEVPRDINMPVLAPSGSNPGGSNAMADQANNFSNALQGLIDNLVASANPTPINRGLGSITPGQNKGAPPPPPPPVKGAPQPPPPPTKGAQQQQQQVAPNKAAPAPPPPPPAKSTNQIQQVTDPLNQVNSNILTLSDLLGGLNTPNTFNTGGTGASFNPVNPLHFARPPGNGNFGGFAGGGFGGRGGG